MHQPPSYNRLKPSEKVFVLEFIRSGCDAFRAMCNLHQSDDEKTNRIRANRMMKDPEVIEAISDKMDRHNAKHATTREAMIARIDALMERALALPDGDQKLSVLKFHLECTREMNRILGYHTTTHLHKTDNNISIELVGVDDQGVAIVVPEEQPKAIEEGDPSQLAISFPSFDPVSYDLSDLDDISEEVDPQDDDLPFDV